MTRLLIAMAALAPLVLVAFPATSPALAQSSQAANPLRPSTARTAPAVQPAEEAPRPRRGRQNAPAAEPDEAAPSAPEKSSGRQPSAGQLAARERQKKCGAEWRQKKEAGQIAAGQKWPQFWSACNTRLKARGA